MRHRRFWLTIISIITIICLALVGASFYFFHVACVPGHKSFITTQTNHVSKTDPLYRQKRWYLHQRKYRWQMELAGGHYCLDANYLPDGHSHKTAILLHGYMDNKNTMGP